MKSLTQISMKLHISKPSLIARMRKISDFKPRFYVRRNNQIYIKDKGIQLISYQKHNSTSAQFHTKRGGNKNELTKSDLINTIHQLLSLNNAQKQEIQVLKNSMQKNLSSSNFRYHLELSYTSLRKYLKRYNSRGSIYRFFHKI